MSEDTPPYGTSDPAPRVMTQFEQIPTPAPVCFAAVEYAAELLGRSPHYRLHVSRIDMDSGVVDELL
jgi:hypothetical protein